MVDCVLVKKIKSVVAKKFNVYSRKVRKWEKNFEEEGESGLEDRSSRPHINPNGTPPEKVQEIIAIRNDRKMICEHIA